MPLARDGWMEILTLGSLAPSGQASKGQRRRRGQGGEEKQRRRWPTGGFEEERNEGTRVINDEEKRWGHIVSE